MAFILHVHGVQDRDIIDFSSWPIHIPRNVQTLFYQVSASDHDIVQHQLINLPKGSKEVFIEIKTEADSGPVTIQILGLQQIGVGVQAYFTVVAEGTVDITEGVTPTELKLEPSKGKMCTDSMFDLMDEDGLDIQISHKHGSKYWIKTPRSDMCTQKIILLQQMQSKQTYMIFTENSWTFKSIPFLLQPGREYRCIVYYSTRKGASGLLEIGAMNETNNNGTSMTDEFCTHTLIQTTKEKIASIYFTKGELDKMRLKAIAFVYRKRQNVSTIPYFYRNKSVKYYEDIKNIDDGVMYPTVKDNNGDRYSILNSNIQGIFFSGLLLPKTLKPPKVSIFGTRRLYLRSTVLLNHQTKMYFADFYCYNNVVHYLTLVLAKPGSPSDSFCQQNLVELDMYNNPFLQLTMINGVQQVIVTLNVVVEVFFTEAIDLRSLSRRPGLSLYEDVPLAGRGSSVEGGLPKKEDCEICNL